MKKLFWLLGLPGALLASACTGTQDVQVRESSDPSADHEMDEDDGEDEDEYEEDVPLSELPAVVKEAALAAVPGLVLVEAEKETENGAVHYCVHGRADGEFVEVEVTPKGEVVEIERGDDDEDD